MAYTDRNFTTKKALKAALAVGDHLTVYQPGPFGGAIRDGQVTIEGPHFPQPHRWYARVEVKGGVIVSGSKVS